MTLICALKVVSATFLLVSFVCLKESSCETTKNVFYFISNFTFSDIQMSWSHQMPKRETGNRFYWEVNTETQSGNKIWPVYVAL